MEAPSRHAIAEDAVAPFPAEAAADDHLLAPARSSRYAATQHAIRSQGALDIVFRADTDRHPRRHILGRSFQSGCLRLRLPRGESAEMPGAIIINTAGGIAGGDILSQSFRWEEGARATVTTQAAEKVYRTLSHLPAATVDTMLHVGRDAHAEWLPQEAILFDDSRLHREARVLLDARATFLGVEAVILGRAAMGEAMRTGSLSDRLRIWRDGRLVYADALRLDGEVEQLVRRAAIADGMRAMAVIVHAGPSAPAMLEPLRAAMAGARARAAASARNGLLGVRLLAPDGETLRGDIAMAFAVLRQGRPLPRVWRC